MSARQLKWAHAAPVPLAQNAQHAFAARHALAHWPSGAVCTFIPKNACSTLRLSLAIANGCIPSAEHHNWIHANNQTFVASLRELATASYTFVLLRDPFERVVSAYLDKIVGHTVEAWQLVDQLHRKYEINDLTFERFVELMERPAIRRSNIHWRNQADFLVYERYDDYFSLDDMPQAAQTIRSRCGLELQDARPLTRHGRDGYRHSAAFDAPWKATPVELLAHRTRTGEIPSAQQMLTEALRASIANSYASDLMSPSERKALPELPVAAMHEGPIRSGTRGN